jgi:hypothetical protein
MEIGGIRRTVMSRDWVHVDETDEYLIDYLFDLNGYIILKNAVQKQDLEEMNQWIDYHWDYVEEIYLEAGDALMFTDALTHGSSARTNAGYRRTLLYRYSPGFLRTRFNYVPSQALMDGLNDEQRTIVQPIPPRFAPGRRL